MGDLDRRFSGGCLAVEREQAVVPERVEHVVDDGGVEVEGVELPRATRRRVS